MSNINYPIQTDPKTTARSGIMNARLSWKDSIEMGRFIKGMKAAKAKAFLQDVIRKKRALPLPRFNDNRGHKPGKLGPGRYPVNVSRAFLELIESAEKNAEHKGLDEAALVVKYVFANKGGSFSRPRRNEFRGQIRKSANISIILEGKEIVASAKKAGKHAEKKSEEKKSEAPKQEKPAAKAEPAKKNQEKTDVSGEQKKE